MVRLASLSILTLAFLMPASQAAECKREQAVMKVNGMVCDYCAQSIVKYLEKQGYSDVKIDLTAETVSVPYDTAKRPDDKALTGAIDYAGYDVVSLERSCI